MIIVIPNLKLHLPRSNSQIPSVMTECDFNLNKHIDYQLPHFLWDHLGVQNVIEHFQKSL